MNVKLKKACSLAAMLGMGLAAAQGVAAQASCEYVVDNDWGSGAVASIRITNNGTSALNGWDVSWSYENNTLLNSWNANISGSNPYTASNLGWNGTIQPGQTVSFGLQLATNGAAETPTVMGDVCDGGDVPNPDPDPDPNPDPNPSERVDNPFENATWYVDPVWSAKAAAEPGGSAIANENTAVWMDRIGAITDGIGLRGHLDEAVAQGADMFMFVVYNLPNRDCAALASNGELRISENGMQRYKDEYIDPIVDILGDPAYADLRIVAIIEVDSLPNLVTNMNEPDCQEAAGPGGYVDGIQYALNQLGTLDNVYSYLDIAHSGWLGWSDNFSEAVTLIANAVKGTEKGVNSIAGFASNSANYTPVREPFLPNPDLQVGGGQVKSADFYEYNPYFGELEFVQDWRQAMINQGFPSSIGMLIDTGRNGWGGDERPVQQSSSNDLNTFVNESRIDRRQHRGNWCNQPGGVGYRPQANPEPGVDAYVWIKPQGESDGVSDPNFEQDPNDPNKKHDPMCDPNAQNRYADDPSIGTGALPNAPHAGRWFPEAFQVLLENAYPPL